MSDQTITKGNYSYIPLDIEPEPHPSWPRKPEACSLRHYPGAILDALNAFEAKHPELEVTGWTPWMKPGIFKHEQESLAGVFVSHRLLTRAS